MQIFNSHRPINLPPIHSSDILPMAFAGLSVGVLMLSVSQFWLAVSVSRLSNRQAPTLVQQVNGQAYTVRPADYRYREPEVIRKAVSDWAMMTFTWGQLPGDRQPPVDDGVKVAGGKRIPTAAWEASFMLAPDFRDAFLQTLAAEVIPEGVFDGRVSAVLIPQHVSPPEAIGDGRWQVDLIATRILFDEANPSGTTIPFNRRVTLQAVDPPNTPLIPEATDYQQVAYRLLEGGLQIQELRPITAEDMAP